VLLFLVLRRMMRLCSNKCAGAAASPAGALWPSAFVAAIFAIHPLRVESVAWVAERKDMLSGLFFMLTLLMYTRYVEQAKVQRPKAKVFYGLTLLFFTLGLMSKQMLVTVPFVLLLLDYWPLRRFVPAIFNANESRAGAQRSTVLRLVLEKLPLLLLAIVAGFIAFLTQKSEGAVAIFERLPFGLRLANGLVSYLTYTLQMFWPDQLALFYPYPAKVPTWKIVVAGALLLFGTVQAVVLARRFPYLLVGWLWYLGMLVPVIGLVQVGFQSHADRFTYLPQIGLYLLTVWAIKDLAVYWRWPRRVAGAGAAMVVGALMLCAWKQTAYWRNNDSLWTHSLACTANNFIAHNNLGMVFLAQDRLEKAGEQFQRAVEINPAYAYARNNLAGVLAKQGRNEEAIEHYGKALEFQPDYFAARFNLGVVLAGQGRLDEAIEQYKLAQRLMPDSDRVHYKLGLALEGQNKFAAAMAEFQETLRLNPGHEGAKQQLHALETQIP